MRPSSSSSIAYDGSLPHFPLCSFKYIVYRFIYASNIVWEKKEYYKIYIKMCMIYKQCNYYILLLLYDFEWENVEIKQTWNLKLEEVSRSFHVYFHYVIEKFCNCSITCSLL